MSRFLFLTGAAGAAVLAGGLAAAKTDSLAIFPRPEPAVDREAMQDRLLARAAFTEVLSKRADTLGMKPPGNLPGYAPIYPDGMIFYQSYDPASGSGGLVQYAAAAPLRATLHFYEDAAALHRMPFTVKPDGPDGLIFQATRGSSRVQAKLTRQFENGTQVDLTYN